jgi:hypothetical protein
MLSIVAVINLLKIPLTALGSATIAKCGGVPGMVDEQFISISDAAGLLGLKGPGIVRDVIRRGLLKANLVDGQAVVSRRSVAELEHHPVLVRERRFQKRVESLLSGKAAVSQKI